MHKSNKYITWMLLIVPLAIAILLIVSTIQKDKQYKQLADACTQLGAIPVEQYPAGILCLDIIVIKKP